MLKTKKTVSVTGESRIDDVVAETYNAVLSAENPQNLQITRYQNNAELYKENRVQCRKDMAEYEEIVYVIQDELIAELEEEQAAEA